MRQKIENLRQRLLKSIPPANQLEISLPVFYDEELVDLFISRTIGYALHDDRYVDDWVAEHLKRPKLFSESVPLRDLASWRIDPSTGNIGHSSGRFFTMMGVKVRHRQENSEIEWDQPIIDQPEVGILGILAKHVNGVLHFCLQAKEEPGNLNGVQLSPTVQATYSNYTGVHGGSIPPFLEFFLNPPRERVLFAKLQTEDGGRFLFKSNRNMIILVGEDDVPETPDGFIWLTLRQIARLLHRDNLLNACARSVLSSLLFPMERIGGIRKSQHAIDSLKTGAGRQSEGDCLGEIVQWLDDQRAANHLLVKRMGLNELGEWLIDGNGHLSHCDGRFFRVIGIDVASSGREVATWSQPIIDNSEPGIIGLLMKKQGGRRYFLMQAKAEVGNRGVVLLGPTVQFTPGNYCCNLKLKKPFLFEEFSGNETFPVVWDNWQAEEGARFYRETHRHRILLLPEGTGLDIPPDFRWISDEQLSFFIHMGEFLNSCARSILSCLLLEE